MAQGTRHKAYGQSHKGKDAGHKRHTARGARRRTQDTWQQAHDSRHMVPGTGPKTHGTKYRRHKAHGPRYKAYRYGSCRFRSGRFLDAFGRIWAKTHNNRRFSSGPSQPSPVIANLLATKKKSCFSEPRAPPWAPAPPILPVPACLQSSHTPYLPYPQSPRPPIVLPVPPYHVYVVPPCHPHPRIPVPPLRRIPQTSCASRTHVPPCASVARRVHSTYLP